MTEHWLPIKGFEEFYEISSHGRIWSKPRTARLGTSIREVKGKYLQGYPAAVTGYIQVGLWKYGRHLRQTVHRLVATHFIPNPKEWPQVNHKDGIKSNNHADNLEWCDGFYNHQHAVATGLQKAARGEAAGLAFKGAILVFDQGVQIDRLCGPIDMRAKGYHPSSVYKATNGDQRTYRNLTFIRQPKP
jgi:hypothetical protein